MGATNDSVSREDLENREDRELAPWAARSATSRGRRHPEAPHAYRTAFVRDRDRIVHSTAFRRLEYKTQVFVNHEGDYYRTRLTHTIETAQIARTVARSLRLNEDLTEAIALAHDLGHTPFGHSGQDALSDLMRDHGGFEHNRQSLRVVDLLEDRYHGFRGLNLSYEVRESIAKHSPNRDGLADLGIDPEESPLLESQLTDICDSIAYGNHDIDDGLKARAISLDDLEEVPLWSHARREVESDGGLNQATPKLRGRATIRRLIDLQVNDLIQETAKRLAAAGIDSVAAVRATRGPLSCFSADLEAELKVLRRFLFHRVYRHHRVCRMAEKAKRFLRSLFVEYQRYSKSLPPEFQAWGQEVGMERAICDYIAGMTDRFALKEYERLFAPFEIT